MSYIHKNIRLLISQHKISPGQLTEETGYCCVHGRGELDMPEPTTDQLLQMGRLFHMPVDRLIGEDLSLCTKKIKNADIKMLALDVDGVMTDGGMYYTEKGDELKKFNTKDGMALIKLAESGLTTALISSGINDHIIKERGKRLQVSYIYVGTWKKLEILEKWCSELKISLAQVAYIGDDINDLEVISAVGLSACPADAVYAVRMKADVVLEKKGGEACVREFAERFLLPGLK